MKIDTKEKYKARVKGRAKIKTRTKHFNLKKRTRRGGN